MTDYEVRELSFRGKPYKIACLNRMEQDPSWFSFDDEAGVRDRDWDIKPGDVVFDIGSAYGSYALTALASGAAYVVCWNPNQSENKVLCASSEENGWIDRIETVPHGLWSDLVWLRDTDLLVQEYKYDDQPEGFFLATMLDRDVVGHVSIRTLDGIMRRAAHLDWMKLDVEGAEVEVLKGAEQTIRRFRPRILVELHLFKDGTLGTQVTELLAGFGYMKVSEHPYHAVAHAVYAPEER